MSADRGVIFAAGMCPRDSAGRRRPAGPPMLPPDFSVTVRRTHDTVTLAVAGELDLAAAPLLAAHLDAVGAADGSGGVVLDLSGLTFLDSSGVALLIGVTQRAEREGWPLRIAGTPPEAHRVLEICGLLDVLPLVGERGAPR